MNSRTLNILGKKMQEKGLATCDDKQCDLVGWVVDNVSMSEWDSVSDMFANAGLGTAYCMLRERCGEMGI